MKLDIQIKRLHPAAQLPEYKTDGAAGFDLRACLDTPLVIGPGEIGKVAAGLSVFVGDPYMALYLMARSGLASKGINLANGVGLIDSDYQGELCVLLHNGSAEHFIVNHGDRIAQGVFGPVIQAQFTEVAEFSSTTERGTGGFGSTGVH